MKNKSSTVNISGILGYCGYQEVFLGFAPANLLWKTSFADVLNEDTGEGYQRPYNKQHSISFKEYISRQHSSTIPLTFNLRKDFKKYWVVQRKQKSKQAVLVLDSSKKNLFSGRLPASFGGT